MPVLRNCSLYSDVPELHIAGHHVIYRKEAFQTVHWKDVPVAHYPSFQWIWVRSYFQHMYVMVCFQNDRIQIAQMFYGIIIIYPEIRCNCNRFFSFSILVTRWFVCIMGNCKRIYIQCSQVKMADLYLSHVKGLPEGFPRLLQFLIPSIVPGVA